MTVDHNRGLQKGYRQQQQTRPRTIKQQVQLLAAAAALWLQQPSCTPYGCKRQAATMWKGIHQLQLQCHTAQPSLACQWQSRRPRSNHDQLPLAITLPGAVPWVLPLCRAGSGSGLVRRYEMCRSALIWSRRVTISENVGLQQQQQQQPRGATEAHTSLAVSR